MQETSVEQLLRERSLGFDFALTDRNSQMMAQGLLKRLPNTTAKSGTTICGVIAGNIVVLAADTRSTAGDVIADKMCEKLHPMAPNVWAAGAGTAADLDHATSNMARQLDLLRLNTGTETRTCTVVRRMQQMLYKYQGHIGTALVLGGVDCKGPHLYEIAPHGSAQDHVFAAMGSGSLAAIAVLEHDYKENLSKEAAMKLCADAIEAGMRNDGASGGMLDVVVLEHGKQADMHRGFRKILKRPYSMQRTGFQKGDTVVLAQ